MNSASRVGGLIAVLLAAAIGRADDAKPADKLARLKEEFAAYRQENRLTEKKLSNSLKPGAIEADRAEAIRRHIKQDIDRQAAFARRALDLARADPEAPEAVEALAWVVDHLRRDVRAEIDVAYGLLAGFRVDDDAIIPVVWRARLRAEDTDHAGAFLRAVLERSSNHEARALACYGLGYYQQDLARLAEILKDPAAGKPLEEFVVGFHGPDRLRRLRAQDSAALEREAAGLFERTLKEFAGFWPQGPDRPSLGARAERSLFQLRDLRVGRTVPEIEGVDLAGKPMTLSDFRGKVVVLSFWESRDVPSVVSMAGHEAVARRMEGRPWAVVGVNRDSSRYQAALAEARAGIKWRSFWDGDRFWEDPTNSITARWAGDFDSGLLVGAYPRIYLIDARGIIRRKSLDGRDLDEAIASLVAEAEAAGKATP